MLAAYVTKRSKGCINKETRKIDINSNVFTKKKEKKERINFVVCLEKLRMKSKFRRGFVMINFRSVTEQRKFTYSLTRVYSTALDVTL